MSALVTLLQQKRRLKDSSLVDTPSHKLTLQENEILGPEDGSAGVGAEFPVLAMMSQELGGFTLPWIATMK